MVAKFIFPYGILAAPNAAKREISASEFDGFVVPGWGDFECAAFGSVLAATDPVAVVGLLKARMVAVHGFNCQNGFAGRLDEFGQV